MTSPWRSDTLPGGHVVGRSDQSGYLRHLAAGADPGMAKHRAIRAPGIRPRRIVIGILRRANAQPARHMHHVGLPQKAGVSLFVATATPIMSEPDRPPPSVARGY